MASSVITITVVNIHFCLLLRVFWSACLTTITTAKSFNCWTDVFLGRFHHDWTEGLMFMRALRVPPSPSHAFSNLDQECLLLTTLRIYTLNTARGDHCWNMLCCNILLGVPKECKDQPWCFVSKRWWTQWAPLRGAIKMIPTSKKIAISSYFKQRYRGGKVVGKSYNLLF